MMIIEQIKLGKIMLIFMVKMVHIITMMIKETRMMLILVMLLAKAALQANKLR